MGLPRESVPSPSGAVVPPGVLVLVGLTLVLLVVLAPRYGWHRDELYFLEAGRHLARGYVDQPPFTPFLARLADTVAPGNLVVLRIPSALATGATIVAGSLFVRELGGDRRRQVLGAAAVATGAFTLSVGHLLATATFDLLAWSVVLWLTARLLRTGDPRLWPVIGAVAGLALLNKNLIVLLFAALAVAVVVERRWTLLRTPWLVLGIGTALALAAPHLVWQAQNGWPQFALAGALEARIGMENRALLVPMQVLLLGPLLVPALVRGARWLAADPVGRTFRPVLWAWPAGLVLALAAGGRPYYVLPLTFAIALAGIAATGVRRAALAVNAAVALPIALPILPLAAVPVVAMANETAAETVGWPELVDQVADVVAGLPPEERDEVVLIAGSYGEAGAVDRFGGARGLPPAYSPHNAYADFRQPNNDTATVIAIRFDPAGPLTRHFEQCSRVATIDNGRGIPTEAQDEPILVCRGLRGNWAEVWEQLRFVS